MSFSTAWMPRKIVSGIETSVKPFRPIKYICAKLAKIVASRPIKIVFISVLFFLVVTTLPKTRLP